MKVTTIYFLLNIFLTWIFCTAVGPAPWKLKKYFGLVGWAGSLPYYYIHFMIGLCGSNGI